MRAGCIATVLLYSISAFCTADSQRPFSSYRHCDDCVAAGHGWCPIRRKCGGFANRECIGGDDPRDVAASSAPRLDSGTFDELVYASGPSAVVFFTDSGRAGEDAAALGDAAAAFEELAVELAAAGAGVRFGVLDAALYPHTAALVGVAPGDAPTLLAFPPGDAEEAAVAARGGGFGGADVVREPVKYDAATGGGWGVRSLRVFVKRAAIAGAAQTDHRIPALDDLAARFIRTLLFAAPGSVEDIYALAVTAAAVVPRSAEAAAAVYLDAMRGLRKEGVVYVSVAINSLSARDETRLSREERIKKSVLSSFSNILING